MNIFEDFGDLVKDIGADTLKLGRDMLDITCDGIREFADDPIAYTIESAEEIAGFAGSLVMLDCCSRRVSPVIGSVVYYRMFNGLAEHSGIYVGDGMIVHLNGFGFVDKVSLDEFIYCMNALSSSHDVYVSSCAGKAVGLEKTAERAEEAVGSFRDYNVVWENCHQFVSGCITGDVDNGDNLMGFLKDTCRKEFGVEKWCLLKK